MSTVQLVYVVYVPIYNASDVFKGDISGGGGVGVAKCPPHKAYCPHPVHYQNKGY